jgi:hypothetical protein
MANLTITPANVEIGDSSTVVNTVQFGEAVSAGQPVFRSISTSKSMIADGDVTAAESSVIGITLDTYSADDYGVVVRGGFFIPGATLVAGTQYVLSPSVGLFMPAADLTTGDFITPVFFAVTTTLAYVTITPTGLQMP